MEGTLESLNKESKAKIGKLYEQLLVEREEKEEILENYNYEKEKFEQIIDLLQSQRINNERVEVARANLEEKPQRGRIDTDSLEKVPFDCLKSDTKPDFRTPDQHQNFHSPTPGTKRSELASPIQYFDKVINDIKGMKDELARIQQDQVRQFALASPLSTLSNTQRKQEFISPGPTPSVPESIPNTGLKSTPKLSLADLASDRGKGKYRGKENIRQYYSDSSSESSSEDQDYYKMERRKKKENRGKKSNKVEKRDARKYKRDISEDKVFGRDKKGAQSTYLYKKHENSLKKNSTKGRLQV